MTVLWEPVDIRLMHMIDNFHARYGHNPHCITLSEELYIELWRIYRDIPGFIKPHSDRDGLYITSFIDIPVYMSKGLQAPQIILGSVPKMPKRIIKE